MKFSHYLRLLAVVAAVVLPAASASALATKSPVIAAASSLQFALEEVAAAFASDTGNTVRVAYGSSGNLARQIRQGAPFELFLSANEDFVTDLARDGFTRDPGVVYAIGRLALFIPTGSPLRPDGALADLDAALADGRVVRFAIANPNHAPYGQRAAEALRHQDLWEDIEPNLVFGENVSQAAQFAASGNAQGGIIPHALAVAPRLVQRGDFGLIPADWHTPLNQRMALTNTAGPVAEQFYGYLQQDAARAILTRFGFAFSTEID